LHLVHPDVVGFAGLEARIRLDLPERARCAMVALPSAMSFQRNASTSPRRAPSVALAFKNVVLHQGSAAAAISMSC
jgi:hypothetical protein